MFLAAPMPTGMESAMPITVETTVIQRLSAMPSTISSCRLGKSGGKNAEKKLDAARDAFPHPSPVDRRGLEDEREIDRRAERQAPAQPRAT